MFYTGQDVLLLRHPRMTEASALVLVALLQAQMGKFSWGSNGVTLARVRRLRILVPTVDTDGMSEVDWATLEKEGERLLAAIRERINAQALNHKTRPAVTVPELVFKPMIIRDVFDSCRQAPSWLYVRSVKEKGTPVYPHVTNVIKNNSIHRFISEQGKPPNPGNAITVGADSQAVAYQPAPFYAGEALLELRSQHLTEENALVLCAVIRQAVAKFAWEYKSCAARVLRTRIMVPVTVDAAGYEVVDWDAMGHLGQALFGVICDRVNRV